MDTLVPNYNAITPDKAFFSKKSSDIYSYYSMKTYFVGMH